MLCGPPARCDHTGRDGRRTASPTLLAFATKMENAKSKFNSPFSKVSRRAAGPGGARARWGDLGGTGGARTKPWQLERAARDRRASASDLSRATSTFRESEGGGRPGPHRHTHYTARTGTRKRKTVRPKSGGRGESVMRSVCGECAFNQNTCISKLSRKTAGSTSTTFWECAAHDQPIGRDLWLRHDRDLWLQCPEELGSRDEG